VIGARGFASLPMYDFPWTASALDAVWAAMAERLRAEGIDAPGELARGVELEAMWRDPGLILGQTCGYPYWRGLRDVVRVVATPVYAFEGCEGPRHCSFLVGRRDDPRAELADFRGARAAINARDSNTGMNLFRAAVAPLAGGHPFFAEVVAGGAHARSLEAVASGAADVAAIDCVSFALLARERPELVGSVKILARTPESPGLPLITSPATDLPALRRALFATLEDPALKADLAVLGWVGAEILDFSVYARVAELEQAAIALGYPELA
jgi:ABC-type phosphate/phosphonate transport system substrate-binding protein